MRAAAAVRRCRDLTRISPAHACAAALIIYTSILAGPLLQVCHWSRVRVSVRRPTWAGFEAPMYVCTAHTLASAEDVLVQRHRRWVMTAKQNKNKEGEGFEAAVL